MNMRQRILKRIDEIRNLENGFSKTLLKWDNFNSGIIKTHISDFDFSVIGDVELLILFERIIRRHNT